MIDSTLVVGVGAAFAAAAAGIYSARQARQVGDRNATLETRRVEAEAYATAEGINRGVVADLQASLDRMRQEFAAFRDDYDQLVTAHKSLQLHSRRQDQSIRRLERRAADMERFIKAAGLDLPPHLVEERPS